MIRENQEEKHVHVVIVSAGSDLFLPIVISPKYDGNTSDVFKNILIILYY
jgi:hypothetical protein